MKLHNPGAELFVPDGLAGLEALRRTTHAAISAHQDDIEIMAYRGILECFGQSGRGFLGVVVTDGAGSPRDGIYAKYTDADMQKVRKVEQKKAALVGEYTALALLDYPSSAVKDPKRTEVKDEIRKILEVARPTIVYTHNPADKHDTHVAVILRTIAAIRELPPESRPKALYGCEVWRDLDWMADADKVAFDVSGRESLAAALLGVFDSQICGGKRYDLATLGRRRAHATYHASHGTDTSTGLTFAMDLTPLVTDTALDVGEFVGAYIRRFADDVTARLKKIGGR
jgi:LmbE family N-acetylglucosaminyl deacetylase